MSTFAPPHLLTAHKEEFLDLLSRQGHWTEDEYLSLTDDINRFVDFLELLPWPTDKHQAVLEVLFLLFLNHVKPLGGTVHFAVLRVRIRPGKFREPDLLLVKSAKDPRRKNRFWIGADLTLEVVSPDQPERDLIDKRNDYAEGGVPEYWIVNPQTDTITVLRLDGTRYVEHGVSGVATKPHPSSFRGLLSMSRKCSTSIARRTMTTRPTRDGPCELSDDALQTMDWAHLCGAVPAPGRGDLPLL
jgi:Uma2 family endonuclease